MTVSPVDALSQINQALNAAPLAFSSNSAVLGTENIPTMERLTAILASSPAARFTITVIDHASPNLALDRKRATYIRSSLIARGTDQGRITVATTPATGLGVAGIEVIFTPI